MNLSVRLAFGTRNTFFVSFKITYAVLPEQQIERLQTILNKAMNSGLVSVSYNLREILKTKTTGCSTIINTVLTAYSLGPSSKKLFLVYTRDRGHPYELPCCKYNAYKQSFLNRHLFRNM